MNDEAKSKLDIVFISRDEDQASFEEYFKTMPWKALPLSGMITRLDRLRANCSHSRHRSFERVEREVSNRRHSDAGHSFVVG